LESREAELSPRGRAHKESPRTRRDRRASNGIGDWGVFICRLNGDQSRYCQGQSHHQARATPGPRPARPGFSAVWAHLDPAGSCQGKYKSYFAPFNVHDVLCPLGSAGNVPGTSPGPLSGLIPDTRQGNLAAVLLVLSYRLDQMSLFHKQSTKNRAVETSC